VSARLLPALALAAAVAVPVRADTAYTLTETLIAEWLWDNGNTRNDDDYYGDIKNRLNIGIREPGLDMGLRVDTSTFRFFMPSWLGEDSEAERAEREEAWYARHGVERGEDGDYGHVGDYRLERVYATVEAADGDWRITGGDFYAHLGRGIALSLRKLDELGIDNCLRGGRVDGRIADRVDLTAFAGLVNVANVDERFNVAVDDPLDLLAGGRVAVDLWGGNRLALHAAHLDGRDEEAPTTAVTTYGGALELLDLPYGISFYAEADGLRREYTGGNDDDGFAAYADLSGAIAPVRLGLEFKEYHSFSFNGTGRDAAQVYWEYVRPPTADQEDQIIETPFNVRGGRLKVDVQVTDAIAVFAAAALADDLDEEIDHDAVHGYGGFEIFWDDGRSVVRGNAGYRHAWDRAPDDTAETYRTLVHAKIDVTLHLWGPLSLNANALHEEWSQRDLDQMLDFRRGTVAVSLDWAGIGSVFGTFEYDTQFEDTQESLFGAGGVQWNGLEWLTLRFRAGSMRGGEKCVAGVCRTFPAFDGLRLEAIFRL
jgi:hypothetical protein